MPPWPLGFDFGPRVRRGGRGRLAAAWWPRRRPLRAGAVPLL